jgi:predicted dehydrogenase
MGLTRVAILSLSLSFGAFKMVHIALVGCGGMANAHMSTLQKIDDSKVVAFVDPIEVNRLSFRDRYNRDAAVFESLESLIARRPDKLDAVILVTPHTLHFEQCRLALRAGLHVQVEKPMVTSSAHAYELWRVVKQTGKVLSVALQAPHTAEYQYLAQIRDAGEWGRVQLVQGWLAQGWRDLTIGTWRQNPSLSGGGQMYDSGAHVLNGIMWLLNEPVVEVSCMIDRCDTPVDINGVAIMRFQSGAMGSVAIGGNSPGWQDGLNIQTDRMQIKTGPHGGYLEVKGSPTHRYPHVPTSSHPAAFSPALNFVRAIQGRESIVSPVRNGVLLSALMDAMYESAERRTPISVKPVPNDLDS